MSLLRAIISAMLRRAAILMLVIVLSAVTPQWAAAQEGPAPYSSAPAGYIVLIHPDGSLVVGDQVTFQVQAPPGVDMNKKSIQVGLSSANLPPFSQADFGLSGFENRFQAILPWAWDTSRLTAGPYRLSFQVKPDGPTWVQTVILIPALPSQAQWAVTRSACCVINYITGTAAARDIEQIKALADAQANDVSAKLGAAFKDPIPVDLMSKVLGHGGFTSNEVYISYLDRDYAGDNVAVVLHHEMVHQLDNQLGGDFRPTFFVEGLAVYLTGGHFKREPLLQRAAALPGLDLYLPLGPLADNFYASQHEIGYMEAAALITYMVNTWGWEPFANFYRNIKPVANAGQSAAIDAALIIFYRMSLTQMEDQFLDYLAHIPVNPDLRQDVRLTIAYFDAVRRYQRVLDPSTYFREAWLPDAPEMRKRGITADLLRHPNATQNQALELLLANAREDLNAGRYDQAEQGIRAVNAVLSDLEQGAPDALFTHPLVAQMYAVAGVLDECGMEPQHVTLEAQKGQAIVIVTWPKLQTITLVKTSQGWQTQPACQPVFLGTFPGLRAAWQEGQNLTP